MQQIDNYCLARAIVAAGSLISGGLCVAAGYLAPALIAAGQAAYGISNSALNVGSMPVFTPLLVIGGLLLAVGLALLVWALAPRSPAAA